MSRRGLLARDRFLDKPSPSGAMKSAQRRMGDTVMIKTIRFLFACLAIGYFVAAPALAQDLPQTGIRQVALTEDLVKRFMSSFPQLLDLGKKYDSGRSADKSGSNNPSKVMSAYMANQEARNEMQQVLSDNGFKDFSEWTTVATSVALAYGYVKSGKTPDEMSAQAESAIEKMRNDPRVPDAQKQQMITMMREQMARFAPLPGNLEVAKSMMAELKPVMEME